MKTRAALLMEQPGKWEIVDVELDPPEFGEVLVEMVASGLCHSEEHFTDNDVPFPVLPVCGGHEGSAIVRELGPGVTDLEVGDHVVMSFIPSCGVCRWCVAGDQQLCDNGAHIFNGTQMDGSYRMHLEDGTSVATVATLGTFSELQVVDRLSCVKVDKSLPLETICIVACAVPTGWGSAVNAAEVQIGHVVIVMGCGGVGVNAVQGAAHAGASAVIAVDPVALKRETALALGATAAFATIAEATEYAKSLTNGQGADSAIVAVGVTSGEDVADAFSAIRKGGTVAVTGIGKADYNTIPVNMMELSMYQKRIQGVLYGNGSPRTMIPLLNGLYTSGALKLDEVITRRYSLDEVNQASDDLRTGAVIRGVIEFRNSSYFAN